MKLSIAGPLLGFWNCRCYNIFIRALTKFANAKGKEISKAIILETPMPENWLKIFEGFLP